MSWPPTWVLVAAVALGVPARIEEVTRGFSRGISSSGGWLLLLALEEGDDRPATGDRIALLLGLGVLILGVWRVQWPDVRSGHSPGKEVDGWP